MFASLEAKLITFGALVLLLAAGGWWIHHTAFDAGAAEVQAQWDIAKAQQASVVAQAQAKGADQVLTWTKQFSAAGATYEATAHAHVPQVADSVAAGLAGHALRLRDAATCPVRSDTVPAATARARAADAAATQALADRTQAAIAAVRAGDAADTRERQLAAQVIGLQKVLKAEREGDQAGPGKLDQNVTKP